MKRYKLLKLSFTTLILLLFIPPLLSQTVISETTIIHIDNRKNKPPEIVIEQPDISPNRFSRIDEEELKILGKIKNSKKNLKVIVNNTQAVITNDSIFFADLSLVPGINKLRIDILSEEIVVNRYDYEIYRSVQQTNFLAPAIGTGKYYALIIGTNNYMDPSFNDLDNAIDDALRFYTTITSKYTFDRENVKLLRDATMADIYAAFDHFTKVIKPEDNFLIFYAGHGIWDKKNEIGYWLPSDAKENSYLAWFRNSTLRDFLKSINSKHTLLISDACFSGSIFKSRSAFSDASMAINKLYELKSRKAMTSGTLTTVPDKSAFLRYLLERLNSNTEKYLSSEQLFTSFREAASNNSNALPQFGVIQEVGDEGGNFIFILKSK